MNSFKRIGNALIYRGFTILINCLVDMEMLYANNQLSQPIKNPWLPAGAFLRTLEDWRGNWKRFYIFAGNWKPGHEAGYFELLQEFRQHILSKLPLIRESCWDCRQG